MISAENIAPLMAADHDTVGRAARLTRAGHAAKGAMDPAAAEQAGHDFESMFVGQMLEQMFGDSLGNDLFGDEDTNEVYKGLMMDEYGKLIAKSGGIGIADYVKKELLTLQEV